MATTFHAKVSESENSIVLELWKGLEVLGAWFMPLDTARELQHGLARANAILTMHYAELENERQRTKGLEDTDTDSDASGVVVC